MGFDRFVGPAVELLLELVTNRGNFASDIGRCANVLGQLVSLTHSVIFGWRSEFKRKRAGSFDEDFVSSPGFLFMSRENVIILTEGFITCLAVPHDYQTLGGALSGSDVAAGETNHYPGCGFVAVV